MNLILFLVTGVIAWRIYTSLNHLSTVPRKIPWVGRTGALPAYIWHQISSIWKTPTTINEAYHKYSKHGLICAIPLPFSRPEILLPRSLIRWMIAQDEKALSPIPVQYEITGVKYAFVNPSVHGDLHVYNVLRVNMNRQLPKMIPEIMQELTTRIDEKFELGSNWREVSSHELVRSVIGRVASRVILGDPLCSNEDLLDNMTAITTCVVPSALLLRLFPPFLHPLLSRLTHFFNRVYKRRVLAGLTPYIEDQLELMRKASISDPKVPHAREDILTWIMADAVRRNEPREGLVDRIVCRALVAQFAAMETTTMTISHALLDLCASDPSERVWERLAEEGARVLLSGAPLDLASVNGLALADSALKETLRLRTSIKALATQVTHPQGLHLEDHDLRFPQGSRLSVSAWGIHREKAVYGENADTYDAFRFCDSDGKTDTSTNANLMVSATENYLPFGIGRHSCPGRYFAAVELKLFLAYLAVNYDLKLTGNGRPDLVTVGHFPLPPLKAKLMVRRKQPVVTASTMA